MRASPYCALRAGATHERDRPASIPSAPTCRWWTGRRRSPAAPSTPPTCSQPDMLAGRIYRSPYAHAEIIEVDISEALKLPGVLAIVTGADCDKTFGVLPIARNEHPLARDKVRYKGEPVAAVAAVDEATADKAVRLIKMRVRELPAYFTAGRRPGARRRAPARQEARQPRARGRLRAGRRRRTASPRPTSCARPPTTAPRCARTRWRCTPRSPSTTPCATA